MSNSDFQVLQVIVSALKALDEVDQIRILKTVVTFLDLNEADFVGSASTIGDSVPIQSTDSDRRVPFSTTVVPSPKEFMLEKQPATDVERIAALAYYSTHYRDKPQFKTLDLSKLNTEAAQRKFSNASVAASNAVKQGYLVGATKSGFRQLSAAGEKYVEALPDQDAARKAMAAARPRSARRKKSKKSKTKN